MAVCEGFFLLFSLFFFIKGRGEGGRSDVLSERASEMLGGGTPAQ